MDDYLARLKPTVTPKHYIDAKYRLNDLAAAFPEKTLASLRAPDLSRYVKTKKGSAPNFFRIVRAFFSDAFFEELLPVNPFDRLAAPDRSESVFKIYTPEEMQTVLETAVELKEFDFARKLVLTGFYGMRESEAQRLDVKNIDAEGVIFVDKMKTSKRGMRGRYIEPQKNGWAWMQFLGLPEKGRVVGLATKWLTAHRNKVLKAAKVVWHFDGRRRAFGSYHLAAFENAAGTAELMGHTDAETTKGKYRVARRKDIALAYFDIFPPAAV